MGWVKHFGMRNAPSRYAQRRSLGLSTTAQRWPRRTSVIPGAISIDSNMLNIVEEFIQDSKQSMIRFQYGEAALVMILAKASQGYAQAMSRGHVDPMMRVPGAGWRIPVRRITSRYYHGWKVRRIAPNIWEMYNDSREAFFIEYGIHTSPRRIRRPIRKLSQLKTLKLAHESKAAHRMLDYALGPRMYSNATFTATGNSIGGLMALPPVEFSP